MASKVLPGAGLAHQRHQLDAVVQQGVEGKVLLAIARLDAPHPFAAIQDRESACRRWHPLWSSAVRLGLVSSVSVQNSFGKYLPWPLSSSSPSMRKLRHFLGRDRQLDHARVKLGQQDVVVSIILRRQAEAVGLDAQVDVFGDEDGRGFRLAPSARPAPG